MKIKNELTGWERTEHVALSPICIVNESLFVAMTFRMRLHDIVSFIDTLLFGCKPLGMAFYLFMFTSFVFEDD